MITNQPTADHAAPAGPDNRPNTCSRFTRALAAIALIVSAAACTSTTGDSGNAADTTTAATATPGTAAAETTAAVTTTATTVLATTTTIGRTGPRQSCTEGLEFSDPDNDGWGTCTPAATTTTVDVEIEEGMYIVPDEVPYGAYRVFGYFARLDANQEIIENELVSSCPALALVQEGDAYLELGASAFPVDLAFPIDPFEYECTDGVFIVGLDIQPGRYRITPSGSTAYFARLDDNLDIIDNNISDGQLIAEVRAGDFAFEFSGNIERID